MDRHDFIKTLAEACQKTEWQVHASCLMPNQMLEKIEDKLGEHHSGQLHRESAEAKAQRLLSEELGRLG